MHGASVTVGIIFVDDAPVLSGMAVSAAAAVPQLTFGPSRVM
jgi:hypothetical protein